jgi:hypothetical protein
MKKLGLFLVIVFGLVFLVLTQVNVAAKSNNGNQDKNPNTVTTEELTQAADITSIPKQGEENRGNEVNNRGRINAEVHRSAVANFVQSLLSVADREGGIGQQVRVIAQEQNDSKEITTEAIDKVEKRSKIKTFLLGTDYKNLGVLRSEMVKTRNHIDQLNRLVSQTEDEQNKTELQTQIQNLEKEETDINNFINQNEEQFSLFGWAVKLFIK